MWGCRIGGLLIIVLTRAKDGSESGRGCTALGALRLSVGRRCAAVFTFCLLWADGERRGLRNISGLRSAADGRFGEQGEAGGRMLGRDAGRGSVAGWGRSLKSLCICLPKMAVHERIFRPRWLLRVLAMLTTPCATLLARLAPSLACFPSVHSVTLSLPYPGLGLEQQHGVALGMCVWTDRDGRAVDRQGSGCGGEGWGKAG